MEENIMYTIVDRWVAILDGKIYDRKYTFLSPDEKTIGYTEIREIIC